MNIILKFNLLLALISCSVLNSDQERQIESAYSVLDLIKSKNYEKFDANLAEFESKQERPNLVYHVNLGSYLICKYGVPKKEKIKVEIERGYYRVITFPLHHAVDTKDSIVNAEINICYDKNDKSNKIIYFFIICQRNLGPLPGPKNMKEE